MDPRGKKELAYTARVFDSKSDCIIPLDDRNKKIVPLYIRKI